MEKLSILIFIILSLHLSLSDNTPNEFNDKILQLTDQIFEEQLAQNDKENKVTLVMFYAPWCGHCKRLKTTWNEIANELAENEYNNVTIAAVNCDKESETGKRMRINAYPTVYAFYQGQNYKFKDRRTKEILMNFAFYEFKNVDSKALPQPPTTTQIIVEIIYEIYEVLMEIMKAHPYITICVVLVFLTLFIIIIKLVIEDFREASEYEKKLQNNKKKIEETGQQKKEN